MLKDACKASVRLFWGRAMQVTLATRTVSTASVVGAQRQIVLFWQRRGLHASGVQAARAGSAMARQSAALKKNKWYLTRSLIPTEYSMDGKQAYIEWPLPQLPMRRQMKGRVPIYVGGSLRGSRHRFGPYGMAADTGVVYTQFQLEAAKEKAKRVLKANKQARLYMRVFAQVPRTKKALGARMGKGKGPIDHFIARVPRNRMVMEVGGKVDLALAKEALRRASHALPGKLNFKILKRNPRDVFLEQAKKVLTLHPVTPPFVEDDVDE